MYSPSNGSFQLHVLLQMVTSALRRFAHPLAYSINTSYKARYGKTVSSLELALQCLESSKYKAAYKFIAGSLPMLTVMLSSLSLDEYIPSTTRVFIKIRLLQV